jgi:tetratricopeptide (TPR) repeat protein
VLQNLFNDPARLVRIDAAWATMGTENFPASSLGELETYLENICDQPAGALRRAEFCVNLGRQFEAEKWARKAAEWDPSAAPLHELGVILHAVGKNDEALASMERAVKFAPESSTIHYDLALLYGELNRANDALAQLQEAVKAEPRFGRAWYNLGLAQAGVEKLDDAQASLQKAGSLMPDSADVPYARATIFMRQKKIAEARAAAEQALKIAPDYQPARDLLQMPEK